MEKVVANGVFKLLGTENQVSILDSVFRSGSSEFIAFPWGKLSQLRWPVPISWDDLNDGTLRAAMEPGAEPVHPHYHGDGVEGHGISRPGTLFGEPSQRFMIAGVFWTDGRIKIDIRLENRPEAAREVLSAELAHAVDYGMPITDEQKVGLTKVLHPGGTDQHTWWEKADYGSEYYTLVGEGFMALFTHSYSKMEPYQDPFVHKSHVSMAPKVHTILNTPPIGQQEPPAPPAVMKVYSLQGYRTYHKVTHYVPQWRSNPATVVRIKSWATAKAAQNVGLSACKVCKPT